MSTIEGFHCIQDTLQGPQGVHSRGDPLYYNELLLMWSVPDLNFSLADKVHVVANVPLVDNHLRGIISHDML